MATTLDFTSFFTLAFMGAAPFFTAWLFLIRLKYTPVCPVEFLQCFTIIQALIAISQPYFFCHFYNGYV